MRGVIGLSLALAWQFALGSPEFSTGASGFLVRRDSPTQFQLQGHSSSKDNLKPYSNKLQPLALAEFKAPLKPNTIKPSGSIAVIYPDLDEPYRSIFSGIIDGIEKQLNAQISSYAVGPNQSAAEMNSQLKRNGISVVIALGRQGLQTAASLDRDIAVVAGGILSSPEADSALTGISLTPDPALLFQRLKSLLPNRNKVTVVYGPRNEWLIKLAREAAKAQGLELIAREAPDMATAARIYESIFAEADDRHNAVWLPQDIITVEENTLLPLILRGAWNHAIPVFSSSFLHVKKGVLFSLYPNNAEMGRNLAANALAVLGGEPRKRGLTLLRDVQTAVNLRAASHIGLNISHQQQLRFDFVFPEP